MPDRHEAAALPQFQITVRGRCNLHCLFCAFDKRPDPEDDPLSHAAEVEAQLDALAAAGPCEVRWGQDDYEPTASPVLPRLVAAARRRGISRQRLQTNGLLTAQPGYLEALQRSGLAGVKLDFAEYDAESADTFCGGEGVLQARLATLASCQRLGLDIGAGLLLMRANYRRVGDMVRLYEPFLQGRELVVQLSMITHGKPQLQDLVRPPLRGVLDALLPVVAGVRVRFDLHGMPPCVHRGRAMPANLTVHAPAAGIHVAACQRCPDREVCAGVPGDYLAIYGDAELRGGRVEDPPLSPAELRDEIFRRMG